MVVTCWLSGPAVFLAGDVLGVAAVGLLITTVTAPALALKVRLLEKLVGFYLASYICTFMSVLGLGVLDRVIEPKISPLAFDRLVIATISSGTGSLVADTCPGNLRTA